MPTSPHIRSAQSQDLPALEAIEKACFAIPWSREALRSALEDNGFSRFLLCETDEVLAYISAQRVVDETEILNIACLPEARGRGLATALLQKICDEAEQRGDRRVILEVRVSNEAALGLYRKFGFQVCGRRSCYYADTGEDALIMEKQIIS